MNNVISKEEAKSAKKYLSILENQFGEDDLMMDALNEMCDYFINQSPLDSNVEEAIENLELLLKFKSNSYTDSVISTIKQALEDKNNQLKVLRNERTIWVNENTELMEGNIKLSNRIKKLKALVIDLDNGKGNEIKLNKQLQSKLDNFKEYVYLKNLLIMDSNYRRKYYKNNPNQDVRIDCKRLNELKNILEISKLESLGDEKNE